MQCEAGLVSITGTPETPSKVGISVADIAAGMYAYSGILSALFWRERTGEGATLEVSMLEALGEWMGFPAYFAGYGGEEPKRSGASHAAIAPYGPFACGDGETIFLGIQNEREWKKFCDEVLGREGMAEDDRFDRELQARREPRRATRRDRGASSPASLRRRPSRGSKVRGSRTPGCAPCGSSSTTRSWQRGTAGASSTRQRDLYAGFSRRPC